MRNNDKKLRRLQKQWTKTAIDTANMIFLLALHDEFGFGETRLSRVLERIDKTAESIQEKRLTANDIERVLQEETGLKFVRKEN